MHRVSGMQHLASINERFIAVAICTTGILQHAKPVNILVDYGTVPNHVSAKYSLVTVETLSWSA